MKLLIIGLPDNVTDGLIQAGVGAMVTRMNIKGLQIKCKILNHPDIAPTEVKIKKEETKFITAINGVMKVCPAEAMDSISFRSWFYSKVLEGVIERAILEIIAFGPSTGEEEFILRKTGIYSMPEYAKVALSMLA